MLLLAQFSTRIVAKSSTMCVTYMFYNAEVGRTCDKHTSTTTNVVEDTTYSSDSAPSWSRIAVADITQIFGGQV